MRGSAVSRYAHKKAFGTILLGSSIEFEFGLYTAVFMRLKKQMHPNQRQWPAFPVKIDRASVLVQCHPYGRGGMGSCYVK